MFNTGAADALDFYTTVFKDSEILDKHHYPDGSLLSAVFTLKGLKFLLIGGGPECEFTMASSYMIECEDQAEIDYFWEKLGEDGGQHYPCGWVSDKFGVSWQVVPRVFGEMMSTGTPEQSKAIFEAMMQMTKLELDKLEQAFKGASN